MNSRLVLFLAALTLALGGVSLAAADGGEEAQVQKIVIALSTDDFELHETDLSHLAVGDAETIVTESGKTIDLLRTEEGVEVYVDGERMDPGLQDDPDMHPNTHQGHQLVHKHVEVVCGEEDSCKKMVWVSGEDDPDLEALHGEDHAEKVIVIKRKIAAD
jgi:hypothetical protein